MSEYDICNISVLIVEKHKMMRRIMRDVLREFGITAISEAEQPEEAFKMFKELPTDLIMTDWAPGLDGISFLEKVRTAKDSPDPYVPVIVVTGNSELRHVYIARDAGMTEFLAKPISPKLIYSRIKSVIERYRVFIRAKNFFGPDRRRRRVPYAGPERRDHANAEASDRRVEQIPFSHPERRSGYPGYLAPEVRTGTR